MKATYIKSEQLTSEQSLRFDVDYQHSRIDRAGDCYVFADLFELVNRSAVQIEDLVDDFLYCEIGDVDKNGDISPVTLNFDSRSLLDENYYKKIEDGDIMSVTINDILVPKVRPNLKKFVRITADTNRLFFTYAFIVLRPKAIPELLYYGLRSLFFNAIVSISRQGKGYPTLTEGDLRTLQFDKHKVDLLQSQSIALTGKITEIEKQIGDLKTYIKSTQLIIDVVFAREFGFDYAKFEELKTHTRFSTRFQAFANNPDMRFSAKFHCDAGTFVMEQLSSITNKKIKHYLAEPIVLGASVSPENYSEDGNYYYISMATIKSWVFDAEEANLLNISYVDSKTDKTVCKNDILLARSGEGTIGKVALIDDDDIQGIFADFTMRIRLANYNHLFAYYYFRTTFFQYLVEVYKKGLGNNTNIFPIVIREFPIPDISFIEQQRIVDEIQNEIGKQDAIRAQVADLRGKIDAIIENALTQSATVRSAK
jgi:restriction endonuclease S subunit